MAADAPRSPGAPSNPFGLPERTDENGGRRQVLEKEKMYKILCEVWDSIPLDELRPYMLKTAERWKEIKKRKGKWVGWSKSNKESSRRHGMTE